jgi:hypothetical protein
MANKSPTRFQTYLMKLNEVSNKPFIVKYVLDQDASLKYRYDNALRRVIEITTEYINKNKLWTNLLH